MFMNHVKFICPHAQLSDKKCTQLLFICFGIGKYALLKTKLWHVKFAFPRHCLDLKILVLFSPKFFSPFG